MNPLRIIALCGLVAFSAFAIEASELTGLEKGDKGSEFAVASVSVADGAAKNKTDYVPKIHGVIRTRWEGEFAHDGEDFHQRFQVRNARLLVEGNVLSNVGYYVRIDACDRGKMKILDAWVRWTIDRHWRVQAGQFRIPFGTDCFRGPGSYYFANRSFVGKYLLNIRQVGAKVGYYGTKVPLTVEAGMFNATPMTDHEPWQDAMDYAVKASYTLGNVTLASSFASVEPYGVRMNVVSGSATWQWDRMIVEGEYVNKHYTNHAHDAVDGWNVFGSYALPLRKSVFNQLSFQARYDGMLAHSTGKPDSDGLLPTDDPRRHRITVGSQLAYVKKQLKALIRLNYEHYFYGSGTPAPQGESNKVVAELVVTF